MEEILKNSNAIIVDVRNQWEYEEDHLPHAIHVPLEELAFRISEFRNMQKPVILYCRSGNRSGLAVRLLKQAGLQEVYNGGALTDLKKIILN